MLYFTFLFFKKHLVKSKNTGNGNTANMTQTIREQGTTHWHHVRLKLVAKVTGLDLIIVMVCITYKKYYRLRNTSNNHYSDTW